VDAHPGIERTRSLVEVLAFVEGNGGIGMRRDVRSVRGKPASPRGMLSDVLRIVL
jgi:hypothetical protein